MPFVTTPERVGRRKGMRMSIQILLKARFGVESLELMPEIEKICDKVQLQSIVAAVVTVVDLAEIRRLVSSLVP